MKFMKDKRTKRISIFVVLGMLICIALSFSALASGSTSGVKGTTCYSHGDINADGSITSKDAIRLLYYATLGDEYSVDQDCDFEKDGVVNTQDAIHLLYSVNGLFADIFPEYKLNGTIHAYAEPSWTWTYGEGLPTVQAAYKCACGTESGVVYADVENVEEKAATCTEAGHIKYSASATYADVTYESKETVVLNALGHKYSGTAQCNADRACQNEDCDYVDKAAGHNYGEPEVTEATCTTAKKTVKVCADCDYEDVVLEGTPKGHTLPATPLREELVDEATCEYKQVFKCATCEEEVDGDHVHKHNYVATITKEATCQEDGEKTFKCSECKNTSKASETIAANENAHNWGDGVLDGTIRTYTCSDCKKIRTTVDAAAQKEATVSQTTLQTTGEVEVNNAAIKMDNATLRQLEEKTGATGDVVISVDQKNKANAGITDADLLAQIGDNPVYDFSITVNDEPVSNFNGEITVSLPYKLQPEDDADSIDVWYIKDNGTVEVVKGVYSNGYVTFKTKHFSYYTVTRLTPAQRCAIYGHSETTRVAKATCETDGYTLHVCVRCTETWKTDIVTRTGHNYQETEAVAATCTTDGSKTETCEYCQGERKTTLPKTGHKWVAGETTPATCKASGTVSSTCANENCNETKSEVIPQLAHSEEYKVVDPTCDTKGYTLVTCTECDYETKKDEVSALGHTYEPSWKWSVDGDDIQVELTLTCGRDEEHTVVKDASVDIQKQVVPTCGKEGLATYKAVVSYNQETFEDQYDVVEDRAAHTISDEWKHNDTEHYHLCEVCGAKVDREEHAFDEGIVTTEATCKETGVTVYTCACGYKDEASTSAIGHDFQDGVCSRCDFDSNACNHKKLHYEQVSFGEAEGVCDLFTEYETCDCGEVAHLYSYFMDFYGDCEWDELEEIDGVDEDQYETIELSMTCATCKAVAKCYQNWEKTGAGCEAERHLKYEVYNAEGYIIFEIEGTESGAGRYTEHPAIERIDGLGVSELCGGAYWHFACACGESVEWRDETTCEWEHQGYVDDCETYYCSKCNTTKVIEYTFEEGENCQEFYKEKISLYQDEKLLTCFDSVQVEAYHDWSYDFVLEVESCEDGYTVNTTCKECGAKDSYYDVAYNGYHNPYPMKATSMTEGACEGKIWTYACPCGENTYIEVNSGCQIFGKEELEETDDGYIESWIYECRNCDYNYISKVEYKLVKNECLYEVIRSTEYWYGEEKLGDGYSSSYEEHSNRYEKVEYELKGESCEDGVILSKECTSCGRTSSYENDYHEQLTLGAYDLADYGMCGGEIIHYGCACGQNSNFEENDYGACQWEYWYYDRETEVNVYKCSECGIYRYNKSEWMRLEGCQAQYTESIEFLKGYNVILSLERTTKQYSHDSVYSFKLNKEGGTCSDGYQGTETCKRCDYVYTWTGGASVGEHSNYNVETLDLSDYGFCGGTIEKWECPCGTNKNLHDYLYEGCNWDYLRNDEETNTDWYQCMDCNGFYSLKVEDMGTVGCYEIEMRTYTLYDADMTQLATISGENHYANHDSAYTFKLNGTKCWEGYTVYETCRKCDYTSTWQTSTSEGYHSTYPLEKYDLSKYGFCGGTIVMRKCPCGEQTTYEMQSSNCSFAYVGDDQETGIGTWKCNTCGSYYTQKQTSAAIDQCNIQKSTEYHWYKNDGTEVLSYTDSYIWQDHDYEVLSYKKYGESCEDGITEFVRCKNCGYESAQEYSHHKTSVVEEYDLAQYGACVGARIESVACYCKEESNVYHYMPNCQYSYTTNEYDGEDGYAHNVETKECQLCGLRISRDWYNIDNPNCTRTTYTTVTAAVGNTAIGSFAYNDTYESHNYEVTTKLAEGATDCEGGYKVIYTCKDCKYSYNYNEQGHHMYEKTASKIDLRQYGAVCESYLTSTACACGKNNSFVLNDTKCDIEQYTQWLESNPNNQDTTEGYIDLDSSVRTYTCAVTDPETCGFVVRCYSYWEVDEEKCKATQYEKWQIGYNQETETSQREITVATGTVKTCHSYGDAVESTDEATHTTTSTETCNACGSTHIEITAYNAEGQWTREEETWTNALNNGENLSRKVIREVAYYEGYQYPVLNYNETVSANGIASWSKDEYRYDWENFDCTYEYAYSSNTNVGTFSEYSCHSTQHHSMAMSWSGSQIVANTCTQYGSHKGYQCGVCDYLETRESTPSQHNWNWDSTTQMYKCSWCDLKNATNANGQIVIEDLTGRRGNDGTSYVVGYYNRSNVTFEYNVSVICANGGEFVLEGINFTELTREQDGIQAISFDKAATDAAAAAAFAAKGYEGEYNLRFSFVPSGNDGNFDYAITFE